MLRVHIGERLPWIDSKGRTRFATDEMELLEQSAHEAIHADAQGFHAWECGIVTTSDPPAFAKPISLHTELNQPKIGFPVGVERAYDIHSKAASVLAEIVSTVTSEIYENIIIVSDAAWDADTGWTSLFPGTETSRNMYPPLDFENVRGTDRYAARASKQAISSLVRHWWPSGLGSFASLSIVPEYLPQLLDDVVAGRKVGAHKLPGLQQYLVASRTFDNLGVGVLTKSSSWDIVQRALGRSRWVDGRTLTTE